MPGVLIVEAMAQTAGCLVVKALATIRGKLVYFMSIENAVLESLWCQVIS